MLPGARQIRIKALLSAALTSACLSACGGGGGSDAAVTPPSVPQQPAPAPAPGPGDAQLKAASRFGAQATFGLTYEEIERLARQGHQAWFDDQLVLPPGLHVPIVNELMARFDAGEFDAFDPGGDYPQVFRRFAWWDRAVTSPDLLRQRVAFALSQILVTSDNVDTLLVFPYALSTYYDILITHALGNYRDLLRDVSLSPAMGVYLSHLNNARSDPNLNRFPDENYAREVMQLFSIGLYELNEDGTRRLNDDGQPIATYDNDDIRELAKIFTGLTFAGTPGQFPVVFPNFREPMQMVDWAHEPGEKRLIGGVVVPAGQSGLADVSAAIDALFLHPNVGPFVGRQLIQRLVTSNPSPEYVARVARAFADNGLGVRGDMAATVRAVLFDPEARALPDLNGTFGKLREPVERNVGLLRQLHAQSADNRIYLTGTFVQFLTAQHPLSAFSVFNFYSPDHQPNGELLGLGLMAPEFEITTSATIVGISNLVDAAVSSDIVDNLPQPFAPVSLDLTDFLALAEDPEALIDRLDILLTAGTLSSDTREAVRDALSLLNDLDSPELVLRTALYLILISPDYSVRI